MPEIKIEDLKCCGNCYSFIIINFEQIACKKGEVFVTPSGYCKRWEYDDLTQNNREIP